jgi:hypothetical protein
MLPEKFRGQHDAYLVAWMRAEEVLKITERIKNETFIPSIKELRYASRRIVQAHVDFHNNKATDEQITVHLTEATENCRKAQHDAVDSAINFVHEQLDKLSEQVGLAVLSKAFPRYVELRRVIRTIDERIVASRTNRCDLDDEYEAIKKDHLIEMVDLYCEMECSEDVIKSILKKDRRDFIVSVILVGLIIGAVVSVATLIGDKNGYFDWAVISQQKQK